jgi:hypothetical protein
VQGAQKQGISVHVKAHKKFDNAGVGLKEAAARSQDWTLDMTKFSAVLSGLREITAADSAGASSDDSTHSPTLRTKSSGKLQKKRRRRPADGEGSCDETGAAQPNQSGRRDCSSQQKSAAHSVQYKKRKQQKMVKGYSSSDLAAILGQAPGAQPAINCIVPAVQCKQPNLWCGSSSAFVHNHPHLCGFICFCTTGVLRHQSNRHRYHPRCPAIKEGKQQGGRRRWEENSKAHFASSSAWTCSCTI